MSKDDEFQGESASISNQRAYLLDYCKQNGWDVVAEYVDDGYTGLNMDRPDLKRMLDACEKHYVNKELMMMFYKTLSGNERYVFIGRYVDGLTMDEVAKELHLTKGRVCQIDKVINNKMKLFFITN